MVRNVIIDVDVGTDDAWALLLLLKTEKLANLKIKAITCVHGNTNVKNVSANVIRILSIANRTDIPVYEGAFEPLVIKNPIDDLKFHGSDGLGDVEHDSKPNIDLIQNKNAIIAIQEILFEEENKTSIICVGPLTNLALCLKCNANLNDRIEKVYIMGGNCSGVGNSSKSAEFNFFMDPEAAYVVLDKLTCPIVILPWETCVRPGSQITMQWRVNIMGAIENDITNLMNKIDVNVYKKHNYINWIPCDALLVACFVSSSVITKHVDYNVTVELSGYFTRGQMVLDHLQKQKKNASVIVSIDEQKFMELMLFTAGHHLENIENNFSQ